ncbi:MAG: hypothetical protein IT445_08365 [Phycisphaeraceae bacterium]|nr:hypothetical protein [Phycisphaeraceae bacterium]
MLERGIKQLTLAGLAMLLAISPAAALTIMIDFNDPAQANTTDVNNSVVSTFDITAYGFSDPADRFNIYNGILTALDYDFHGIPTASQYLFSPIPDGYQLDIDFEIGDVGSTPANGDSEYYFVQLGSFVSSPLAPSNALGLSVNFGAINGNYSFGSTLASIFTNSINLLDITLTEGNLNNTINAINGTLAHEIGHTLSLQHVKVEGAMTPTGLKPIMATGTVASGLQNADRLIDREFATFAALSDSFGNQPSLQQLVNVLGLRPIPEPGTLLLIGPGLILLYHRRPA